MKHTKGKWEIGNFGKHYGFKDCIFSKVKNKFYPKYSDHPTETNVIATMQYWDKDENRANANLIASAPEMLEVLKEVNSYFGSEGLNPDRVMKKKTDEVIAKAEGK